MAPSRIKINFAIMNSIAKTFEHQAEAVRIEIGSLQQKIGVLQAGDWQGSAAEKFYAEMEATVLPSLQHLAVALETGAQTTIKVSQIMQQAQVDAAKIFKSNGAGAGPVAHGDGAAQGANGSEIRAPLSRAAQGASVGSAFVGSGSRSKSSASPAPANKLAQPSDFFPSYPIFAGTDDKFTRKVEHKKIGILETPEIERDDSFRTLNQAGLKSFITDMVHGDLTDFEKGLVSNWGKDNSAMLVPVYQRDVGLFGYELVTGGSGDRLHTVYTRTGEKLSQSHTEAGLVNEGLGPIDYAMEGKAAADIGKSILSRTFGRVFAKKAIADGAREGAAEEAGASVPSPSEDPYRTSGKPYQEKIPEEPPIEPVKPDIVDPAEAEKNEIARKLDEWGPWNK